MFGNPVDLAKKDQVTSTYLKYIEKNNYQTDINDFTNTSLYEPGHDSLIATRPKREIDWQRVAYYIQKITAGQRPFAILISATYLPEHEYSATFILDGHHKLIAYEKLRISPPLVIIEKDFQCKAEIDFDLERLSELLYPWQMRHIIKNTDDWHKIIGSLKSDSPLQNYVKNGSHILYHENGKVKSKGVYTNDRPEGSIKEWHFDGSLKSISCYTNGVQTGRWQSFHSSGNISNDYSFNQIGEFDGPSYSYFPDGTEKSFTRFTNGQYADGYGFSKYNHTRKLNFEFWYENGILVKKKTYSDNGGLIIHEVYDEKQKKLVPQFIPEREKYPPDHAFHTLHNTRSSDIVYYIRTAVFILIMIGLFLAKCHH